MEKDCGCLVKHGERRKKREEEEKRERGRSE